MRGIINDNDKIMDNINDLTTESNSKSMLKKSLSLLSVNKQNVIRKLLFVGAELFVALIVARQFDTIIILNSIVEVFINVMLALLAIVFTGYAFFQALLNDRLLIALISDNSGKKNKLVETNSYFVQVMMIQIFCLLVNIVVIISTIIIPDDWSWLSSKGINELIAALLIFAYLHLNIECIWEMKSFIFNTFQLFNLYAYSRIVSILKQEKDKE